MLTMSASASTSTTKKGNQPAAEKKCHTCDKKCTVKNSIKCMICTKYFHLVCRNIAKESLSVFNEAKLSNSGFIWRCSICEENSLNEAKPSDILQQLNDLKNTFNNRINELENLIVIKADNQQKDINTYANAVKGAHNSNTEDTNKVLKSIDERITDMTTNMSVMNDTEKEVALIQQKSNNLCVFNIPESDDADREVEYKHDVEIVQKLVGYEEEVQKDIVKISRRGLRKPDQLRPRPVVLTFTSLEIRQKILQIRNATHTDKDRKIIPLYISPDRTKKQQEEHRQLVMQLKKKKADGETNIGIRNGKIVTLQSFRRDPQLYWGQKI